MVHARTARADAESPVDGDRRATVLNIQRMSTDDGPGLRTTVFLKGCSLECRWCHNPEAVSARPEIVWHAARCLGAEACEVHCPEDAVHRTGSERTIDRARCTLCGACVEECPSGAMEQLGTPWSVEDLVREVAKDRTYFHASGGGVTVSGGEPALRAPFVAAFLERCRVLGLHTALDTCGLCSPAALQTLAGQADLVLYDIKEVDRGRHLQFTGQPNDRILDNLFRLAAQVRRGPRPAELWIRTPLVPGATLTEQNVRGIGALIASELADVVSRWELLAFNNLAGDKYRRLGKEWDFDGVELIAEAELRHFEEVARGSGIDPGIAVVTGRTRFECPPEPEGAAGGPAS